MSGPEVVRYDSDTWLVMRENPGQPKAVIRRVIATGGQTRFLLLTWELLEADRRLVAIHDDLDAAIAAVPAPSTVTPMPTFGLNEDVDRAYQERRDRLQARVDRQCGKSRIPPEPIPPSLAWE